MNVQSSLRSLLAIRHLIVESCFITDKKQSTSILPHLNSFKSKSKQLFSSCSSIYNCKSSNRTDNTLSSLQEIHTRVNDKSFDDIFNYLLRMDMKNKKSLKISIEGNIASGKSSILKCLEKTFKNLSFDPSGIDCTNYTNGVLFNNSNGADRKTHLDGNVNLKVLPEPVKQWRNLNGNNLLELMYKDPKRWAFMFHSYVQLTMLENHLAMNFNDKNVNKENSNPNDFNISIMERSLFSAKYCFVQNIYNCNLLSPVEYEVLDKWFDWITSMHDCNLDIIFYLRTNPETCLERLYKRGRPEETELVTLDYLKNLHDLHDRWLLNETSSNTIHITKNNKLGNEMYKPPTVIVIDADKSIDDVYKMIESETRNAISLAN